METLDYYFTNKVTSTDKTGAVTLWRFTPDHRYAITTPDGQSVGGRWDVRDGKFFILFDGAPAESSVPYAADKKPGDSWQVRTSEGDVLTLAIHS